MSEEAKNGMKRATGLLVIEVVNSNPNGDPDNESTPRQRANGHGEISPVSFKRKLRDLLEDHDSAFFQALPEKFGGSQNSDHYQIMESRNHSAEDLSDEMGTEVEKILNSPFVRKYWDGRVFGNTLLEGKDKKKSDKKKDKPKEFIKSGVVQFGMGISVAPVDICIHTNTRKMPTQKGNESGMAPLAYRVVEHGVYCMPFYVNPNYAHKTGCTPEDIELLKTILPYAYDCTRSAVRPDVRIRHAWYIEHKNILCSCPEYLLVEALTPKKTGNPDEPSASWADYEDVKALPSDLLERVASCVDLVNP